LLPRDALVVVFELVTAYGVWLNGCTSTLNSGETNHHRISQNGIGVSSAKTAEMRSTSLPPLGLNDRGDNYLGKLSHEVR